ncbi:major facilitator superfamily [Diplodia corticola]|uniref:Major facilitator superfamily n=1 Tax=Diplodia corticola TaxID=236234 RepID=A0A1J9SDP4_9PEZI|nr:major facilitator superfamily [Diplodia corticola]OJD37709.1 major facilitator superfamily [Diplodia corticola]
MASASMPRALVRISSARPLRTSAALFPTSAAAAAQRLLLRRTYAAASKKDDSKPRVLEKPDKFRPPSHAARLPSNRKKPQYTYGPRLTEEELAQQKRKKYPNMMPPEGTPMYYFLTNRMLHVYISLAVLFSLAFYVFLANFLTTTPYRDLLPDRSDLVAHPFRSLRQFLAVYRMHADHVSHETAEKRKRKVEDVDKRAEYRRAHGLDAAEDTGLLRGWLAEPHEKRTEEVVVVGADGEGRGQEQEREQSPVAKEEQEGFRDFEGRQQRERRPVKKWLGIW